MKKFIVFVLIVLIITFSAKIYFDTNVFKVNIVQYQSNKIPKGSEVAILQISDFHNKMFENNNEELINTVKNLNADIIVITGDLIDRSTDDFKDVFSFVEGIKAINKDVFFVSGNHEWGNAHTEDFLDGLKERNVTILNNKNTQITKREVTFNLAGVDDVSTHHENIKKAFDTIKEEQYTILLSHSPNVIINYNHIPAELVLSGHTHGGQVRIPFVGALVVPDQGFFPKLDKGTYKFGQNQYIYIDSGLGTSIAPIRFLNKSQLSLIKITNNN